MSLYKNTSSSKQNVKHLLYQQLVVHKRPTPPQNPPLPEPIKIIREPVIDIIERTKTNKLNIIMTCVNYSDFLVVSLSENVKVINPKYITVVTDSNDNLTKHICEVFGVNCVVTDKFYDDDAIFNKGKGINEGIKSINEPDWILLTDADIIFPDNLLDVLSGKFTNRNKLYAASRYLCKSYKTFKKYKNKSITLDEMDGKHNCPPVGYFQLFSVNHPNLLEGQPIYPEISKDASWSDMLFADKFPQKECLQNLKLIHLGEDSQNWKGRKTTRFITDNEFNQIITDREKNRSEIFNLDLRNNKGKDKLAIITCLFNPIGYNNLNNNYKVFKSGIIKNGGDLFTIELSFTGEFVTEESKYNIHLLGDEDNILWQKERLLNILIDKIPPEYNNIAWVDCDIVFKNENWIQETNEKLKYYQIVQLFETANLFDGKNNIELVQTGIIKFLEDRKDLNLISFDHVTGGHPGFGWAARRELLEKYHLMEYQIAGNADGLMVLVLLDQFKGSHVYNLMNPLWQDETIRWGEKIKYEVNKSFTYVTGTINHLYHGKTSNRKYVERCTIVKDCNYDPYKDITIDSNDLLSWKHTNNELQTQLKSYFAHRLEDDNLSVNINEYFDGIFCINLKRKPDKWDVVNQRFKKNGINVTQILAYDGKFEIVKHQWDQVKVNIINKYGSTIFNDPNTLSNIGIIENEFAYGTLCSQIGIIQKAKAEKLKRILIFEDDVIFHKDFNNQLQQIKDLDWNLLYLGASQYDWDGITIKDGKYKAKKTLGCFAYAIDESIYDDILIAASTMEKSFDNILADQIQTTHDDCIVLYPNLVIADVRESELREPRDINEHGQRLHWDLSLYDV